MSPKFSILELARSLFNFRVKERRMALFTAYFDDSGTHEGSCAIAVGGYVSSDRRWANLQKEWAKCLDDAGIEIFRAADFDNYQEPYDAWSKTKRRAVQDELIRLIRVYAEVGIYATVARKDHEFVNWLTRHINPMKIDPYTICVSYALQRIEEWADKYNHHDPIAYIFEKGTPNGGQLDYLKRLVQSSKELSRRFRIGSWTTAGKELSPLQTADILAYETYKEMDNFIVNKTGRPTRKSIERLTKDRLYLGSHLKVKAHRNLDQAILEAMQIDASKS